MRIFKIAATPISKINYDTACKLQSYSSLPSIDQTEQNKIMPEYSNKPVAFTSHQLLEAIPEIKVSEVLSNPENINVQEVLLQLRKKAAELQNLFEKIKNNEIPFQKYDSCYGLYDQENRTGLYFYFTNDKKLSNVQETTDTRPVRRLIRNFSFNPQNDEFIGYRHNPSGLETSSLIIGNEGNIFLAGFENYGGKGALLEIKNEKIVRRESYNGTMQLSWKYVRDLDQLIQSVGGIIIR